ncbi:MAG: hypothetical protein RIQ81_433 [Pseudomonadota bacterium]|jgi:aspartyl-tRNA(Asn)/glutamyl-tRNA(Gln) amidotransferase subunit C
MTRINVDESLVRKVSDLANLYLSEEEVCFYQGRLARILDYVDQLDTAQALGKDWRGDILRGETPETPERSDVVTPSLPVEEAMSQAPAHSGTAFQVPRIIE